MSERRYAAITVMQPYAWLIAHSAKWPADVQGKTLENRSRRTRYRGPVLIHVSRRWERVRPCCVELRRLGLIGGACPEPPLAEMRSQLGQVIAVGELVECRQVGDHDPHPWGIPGSWGWMLEDVGLVHPFGLSGSPGLWYAPRHTGVRRVDMRVDPANGRGSRRVASLVEASRVVLSSVSGSDHVVEVGGEKMRAGELLARAAEEHGEPGTAAQFRRLLGATT